MTPEQTAISALRNAHGWWEGDDNARKVLARYREDVLRPIVAAASPEPQDRDLETCVRRLYHEARAARHGRPNPDILP